MSKFNFKELREKVKQTGDKVRTQFKGTDSNIQAVADRGSEWHAANSERLKDPAYIAKLKKSLQESDAVKKANKEKAKDLKWKTAQKNGLKDYVNSPGYVNPKGMLGKKHKDGWSELMHDKLINKPKSIEHNKKISQSRKGIEYSDETKNKISQTLTGTKHDRSRRVHTNKGIFNKVVDAAKAYGVTDSAIRKWIKNDPKNFYYLDDKQKSLGPKRVHTPDGEFVNRNAAAEHHQITPQALTHRMKTNPTEYYYIKD